MPVLPIYLNVESMLAVAFGGFIGAVIKDGIKDGALVLPYKSDGKLYLGFIGGGLVGSFVGLVFDGNFLTALVSGYMGTSILANLGQSNSQTKTQKMIDENIDQLKSLQKKK